MATGAHTGTATAAGCFLARHILRQAPQPVGPTSMNVIAKVNRIFFIVACPSRDPHRVAWSVGGATRALAHAKRHVSEHMLSEGKPLPRQPYMGMLHEANARLPFRDISRSAGALPNG